jgi:metal-responsive CopG/Arc/MetJ family transcriptional regulator
MGGSPSKSVPVCYSPALCEPYVEYVKRECEKVGNNILHSTLRRVIIALAGETYGNQILGSYNPALGGGQHNWDTIQPEVMAGFKNYEGFVEGAANNDCVKCSCSTAAEKIIAECRKTNPLVTDNIVASVTSGPPLMSSNARQAMGLVPAPTAPTSKWDSMQPDLFEPVAGFDNISTSTSTSAKSTQEPFINRETFINSSNDKIYKFVKDAIQERHSKFKDTTTFQTDCKSSSYYSMDKFITEEKKMLDTLFAYYTNFVSSYESLYLHKEAVIRIINGKLDELEKIQSKIDSYKTNLHVDNRKNNYQNSNYEFYSTLRKYMLILYYSLFVLYLIFSNFLREKQYTNKKILLVLAIYLLIPIILSFAINLTYEGYIYFLESNNIKEDTKSYADIIKA